MYVPAPSFMSKFTMSLCLWNPQNASRVMKYMTQFPVVKQWVFSNSGDPCFKSFNSWIACLREETSPCSIACIRKFSLSLIFTSIADRHTILQYYNTFQAFSMSGSSTEGSMPEVSSCKEFFYHWHISSWQRCCRSIIPSKPRLWVGAVPSQYSCSHPW